MKRIPFILCLICLKIVSFAQNSEAAGKLIDEGVAYHDRGDFEGAISKYDQALKLDKDNVFALAEKAYSLVSLKKYEEAVSICKRAIDKHPHEKGLATVYITYGNALDALNKIDKSIKIYDEGLLDFPNYYLLYFNKGISLSSVKKIDEAIACFQKSASLNPSHASSDNALARLLSAQGNNIPAIMAFCKFLVSEPQGQRASENLEFLQNKMKGKAERTGENNISIKIDPKIVGDKDEKGIAKENNFNAVELLLTMSSVMDLEEKYAKESNIERFIRKFTLICQTLSETKKDNSGFYWDHYAPYFIAVNENQLIVPFAYIVFASSDKPEIADWLKTHKPEIESFFQWDKKYWETK